MQQLTDGDMHLIGQDQTTPIYWQQEPGAAGQGRLSLEGYRFATLRQFLEADVLKELAARPFEPGEIVQLAEGYFVLEEDDLPFL
jgi:hypothetical protein